MSKYRRHFLKKMHKLQKVPIDYVYFFSTLYIHPIKDYHFDVNESSIANNSAMKVNLTYYVHKTKDDGKKPRINDMNL